MRRIFRILAVALLLSPVILGAQPGGKVIEQKGSFLRQLQPRDSVLIADQLTYGFKVENLPEGTGIGLPDLSKGLMDSVEVVRSWQLDTLKSKKGSYDIEGSIVITSFDEGTYNLPALFMQRISPDGTVDTLLFDPQVLEVKTMPVDTATYQLHDIKGQIKYPVTFKEVLPYVLAVLLLGGIAALVVWYVLKKKKEALEKKEAEPSYIIALRKLESFRGDKYMAPEKQKAYFSGITDALREYMEDRYEVDAMEMTTAEIFSELKDKDLPKELYLDTKALFELADFVKFAKHTADEAEYKDAIPTAIRFVTGTFQAPKDEAQAETPSEDTSDRKDEGTKPESEEKDYSAYMPK